jgi:hypothetical protein
MGRGVSDQEGTTRRRVPALLPARDERDHFGPFFRRQVHDALRGADEAAWPELLAERVLSSYHVSEIAKRLGLRLSKADLADLRLRAAQAIAEENLAAMASMEALVDASRSAARRAAAEFLAARCQQGGRALLRHVTAGLMPDEELARVQKADWQALVSEKWRPLAVYRPASIAEFLASRISQQRAIEDPASQASPAATALAA